MCILEVYSSRLSMIVQVNILLNRSVVDSDSHFNNLHSSHLQGQSEFITSVDGIKLWLLT